MDKIFKLLLSAALLLCCIMLNAQQPTGDGSQANPYQIATSDNLVWFAEHVNSGNTSACAMLTADITVNAGVLDSNGNLYGGTFTSWTPIGGQNGKDYSGEFDGNGHTISGLYFNDESVNNIGLFGKAVGNAHIHDLGIKDSYFCGSSWVGGICGDFGGGRIENCWNGATVMSKGNNSCAGGIAGSCWTGASIAGCYNTGKISCTGSSYGGICGVLAKNSNVDASVKDCFTLNSACGVICNDLRDNPVITNSDAKDAAAFASGEVCWLLNNGVTDGSQKWYQTLGGTDNLPVLDNNHGTVYYGYDGDVLTYSNSPLTPPTIDNVAYIDANGVEQTVTATVITDETGTLSAGWYVVTGSNVQTGTLVCSGEVHLILADGAKLTANGDYCQAGIVVSGEGNSLTIYGQASQIGQLIAKGGYNSAGIGGGQEAPGTNITINGGTVTATGDGQAAGIGGGAGGSGSDITVNGGMVVANGGSGASAIGGGFLFGSSNIFVDTKCVVRAGSSANPTDVIENTGADLASSLAGEQYTTIETYAAPIPTTYNDENGESHDINAIPIHPAAARVIWGETGKTTWLVVKDVDVILSLGAVCIGDIHLILADESVLAASGYEYYAAIMVSGEGNSLTIYGQTNQTGKLEAYGGNMGAGIGGGLYDSGSDITINGGMVVARGGTSAAGIGGSWGTSGSNITINGGVVEASGGTSGAGIGGGQEASGTNIIINGGKVAASGGYLAPGIGGGYNGSGSNIFVATSLVVKADVTNPPATVISNDGNDLASLLAGKRFATIDLDLAPIKADAIEEIDLSITGITDETILAVADKAKTDIGNATTEEAINSIKTLALAKINALYHILIARQGIQNAEINSMINDAINGISNATTTGRVNELHSEIATIIGLVQTGRADALGEMGEPCEDCPSVEVTGQNDNTIKLYNPKSVKFKKE